MELNKNFYIFDSQDTEDYGDGNIRIKYVDWQKYNENIRKIKIKNIELERLKKIKISIDDDSDYESVGKPNNKTRIKIEFLEEKNKGTIDKKNKNNEFKEEREHFELVNASDVSKDKNIEKKQQDDSVTTDKVEAKPEKKDESDKSTDNIKQNNEVKKEETKNYEDEFADITQQPIKVFASQVKNPLEWLLGDNEYLLDQSFQEYHMRLASYVVGTIGGTGLGLFLMSMPTFSPLGLAIIIYANLPKTVIQYFIQVIGKFIDFDFSPYYKNVTDYMVKYAGNTPDRIKNKIKEKEEKLELDRKVDEILAKRKARYEKFMAEKRQYQEVLNTLNKKPITHISETKSLKQNKESNTDDLPTKTELLHTSKKSDSAGKNLQDNMLGNMNWSDKVFLEKLFMPQEENSLSLPEKPKSNKSS